MKRKIAVFFDCENVHSKAAKFVFKKLKKKGKVVCAQAFQNWAVSSSWSREIIEEYGIEPVQVFSKSGKNSADLRLVRAAMELAEKGKIDIYAIVSDDSDFRDLALTLRKKGFKILGFGSNRSTKSLQKAYSKFYFYEKQRNSEISTNEEATLDDNLRMIRNEIFRIAGNGFCKVQELHRTLARKNKDFKLTIFGSDVKKWRTLFKKYNNLFEYKENGKHPVVKALLQNTDNKKYTMSNKIKKLDDIKVYVTKDFLSEKWKNKTKEKERQMLLADLRDEKLV